jgi:hypothetical protein
MGQPIVKLELLQNLPLVNIVESSDTNHRLENSDLYVIP